MLALGAQRVVGAPQEGPQGSLACAELVVQAEPPVGQGAPGVAQALLTSKELLAGDLPTLGSRLDQPAPVDRQQLLLLDLLGGEQLCGRGGRGAAPVGGEVGDGEVDLVPDRADDGDGAPRDGPGDDLLVEAFAVLREAAFRVIGQRPFDVQLMGGAALHFEERHNVVNGSAHLAVTGGDHFSRHAEAVLDEVDIVNVKVQECAA